MKNTIVYAVTLTMNPKHPKFNKELPKHVSGYAQAYRSYKQALDQMFVKLRNRYCIPINITGVIEFTLLGNPHFHGVFEIPGGKTYLSALRKGLMDDNFQDTIGMIYKLEQVLNWNLATNYMKKDLVSTTALLRGVDPVVCDQHGVFIDAHQFIEKEESDDEDYNYPVGSDKEYFKVYRM